MADSYEGEPLTNCGDILPLHFQRTFLVAVSGVNVNPCGHMLLNVGGKEGWYFHVAGGYKQPQRMGYKGYQRYLKEEKKTEWRRFPVRIPFPEKALAKLEQIANQPWLWLVIPHNCVNFCETVIRAGGSNAGLFTNCPAQERFKQ